MRASFATPSGARATFASRAGGLLTMIGVAVGLGNVWRFPYMVGTFGGAPFVLAYIGAVILLAVGLFGFYIRSAQCAALAQNVPADDEY